jgi:Spy/CpxP family protein refolding chaperone
MSARGFSSPRSRLIGLALLCAVFVVGALSGAAVDRLLGARSSFPSRSAPSCPERRGDPRRLFDELALTAEQREQATKILEGRRTQMDAFWRESGPRLRAIVDSTHTELGKILTPDQRKTLDRLKTERTRWHEKRRKEFGSHPGGSHHTMPNSASHDHGKHETDPQRDSSSP